MVSRRSALSRGHKTRLWRVPSGLGAVNLMHARFVSQVFAPHFHEGYCLGVVEQGALGFRYMGEKYKTDRPGRGILRTESGVLAILGPVLPHRPSRKRCAACPNRKRMYTR